MTIHTGHPFADPDPDPVRRLRGRVTGTVTLWTAGTGPARAGLTVTSVMLAGGEPPLVLGLLDPDSDLADRLLETRRAVVQLLSWPDRDLADMFAGVAPAPGGAFRQAEFTETEWGPRLATAHTWAGVELVAEEPVGWSLLVRCRIGPVTIGDDAQPLVHRRGRYLSLGSDHD